MMSTPAFRAFQVLLMVLCPPLFVVFLCIAIPCVQVLFGVRGLIDFVADVYEIVKAVPGYYAQAWRDLLRGEEQ